MIEELRRGGLKIVCINENRTKEKGKGVYYTLL